jgi:hypothetical protein
MREEAAFFRFLASILFQIRKSRLRHGNVIGLQAFPDELALDPKPGIVNV